MTDHSQGVRTRTAAAASIHQASQRPPTRCATVAKKPRRQSAAWGMTPRQAISGSRYIAMTSTTASSSARGNVRPAPEKPACQLNM